ncbi:MAG: hypothetical protein ABS36_09915 [Acidobacteria bacterium SCN 69-37]|nr:MAG: hypothetical protein ABS36_09915 [Acidobacteria bacterium SCN 69-37]
MFEPRPRVAHFVVHAVDGQAVDYREIWQRTQLLLLCFDERDAQARTAVVAAALTTRGDALAAVETRLVVTHDVVPGAPRPGALVADRWGEIYATLDDEAVTDADDLIDWMRVVQSRCG